MLRGDIANLRSTFLSATDIYMVAGSNSVIARSSAAEFHRLISDQPHLDTVCIWRAAAERSMLAGHLVDVGGRSRSFRTLALPTPPLAPHAPIR